MWPVIARAVRPPTTIHIPGKPDEDIISPLALTGDSLYLTDRLTNEAIRL